MLREERHYLLLHQCVKVNWVSPSLVLFVAIPSFQTISSLLYEWRRLQSFVQFNWLEDKALTATQSRKQLTKK
jgi:hypothetical protein